MSSVGYEGEKWDVDFIHLENPVRLFKKTECTFLTNKKIKVQYCKVC